LLNFIDGSSPRESNQNGEHSFMESPEFRRIGESSSSGWFYSLLRPSQFGNYNSSEIQQSGSTFGFNHERIQVGLDGFSGNNWEGILFQSNSLLRQGPSFRERNSNLRVGTIGNGLRSRDSREKTRKPKDDKNNFKLIALGIILIIGLGAATYYLKKEKKDE